jgi:hypothetical protein
VSRSQTTRWARGCAHLGGGDGEAGRGGSGGGGGGLGGSGGESLNQAAKDLGGEGKPLCGLRRGGGDRGQGGATGGANH